MSNFCSYPSLDFNFEDLGLAAIVGDTGSGKSTLLDAAAWTIFGITSKEGSADGIRAWEATQPTEGYAQVSVKGTTLNIYRSRAPGKNDLFWTEHGYSAENRGKDLSETQRLLEARLGVTGELFLLGSYLTQFSAADSFFIAKAKDRREVLEQIAVQEFAISLGEKASQARKELKDTLQALEIGRSKYAATVSVLNDRLSSLLDQYNDWEGDKASKIGSLTAKEQDFENEKRKIIEAVETKSMEWEADRTAKIKEYKKLIAASPPIKAPLKFKEAQAILEARVKELQNDKCSACGAARITEELQASEKDLKDLAELQSKNSSTLVKINNFNNTIQLIRESVNPYLSGIQQAHLQTNPYGAQLEAIKIESNPYHKEAKTCAAKLESSELELASIVEAISGTERRIGQLTWLYGASFTLRGMLMERIVLQVESSTNDYLEKHFDAALRIKLSLDGSDKLEVSIMNAGHSCGFRSLSGGERTMLKLAFSLSLMRAAQDKAGISFGMVMLDEPFNGLSSELKVKAFGLLQELETQYGTVLVIDHSDDMKAQFHRSYQITKTGGHSVLTESSPN